MALKIGITESTDPSYDTSWRNKITGVDGLIIITKNIRDEDMRRLIHHPGLGDNFVPGDNF